MFCDEFVKNTIKTAIYHFGWNYFHYFIDNNLILFIKEDCIPEECVPPARWPYLPACSALWGGGGSGPWGIWSWGILVPGGCLSGPRGGGVVSQHALRQTPPVNRILDTRLWKYNLAPTSLRAVINRKINAKFHFIKSSCVKASWSISYGILFCLASQVGFSFSEFKIRLIKLCLFFKRKIHVFKLTTCWFWVLSQES